VEIGMPDETLETFLDFLEKDIKEHPSRLVPMSAELLKEIHDLVGDVDVDLDATIEGDVDL
jgi:antitoxin PrlF